MKIDELRLQKQKTYVQVYEIASRRLLAAEPIEDRFAAAAVPCVIREGRGAAEVLFFDETITVEVPELRFSSSRGANVTLATKILILHYLNTASGRTLSGEQAPYEDIPGCRAYLPVFERRAVKPLFNAFGYNRDLFTQAGEALGGTREEFGDASFTLHPFPRVPVTYILWEGDSEFPPSLKVLFDKTVPDYLPLEDITVVAKLAATRLLKAARLSMQTADE